MIRNKLPHVRQQDKCDCGAACVSTIAQYYGVKINLNEIRDTLRTNTCGTKLSCISKGLNKLGFCNKVYKVNINEINNVFNNIKFPCICMIHREEMNHYVVVYGTKGNSLIVSDPLEYKLKKINMCKFKDYFSGIIISIYSSEKVQLEDKNKEEMKNSYNKHFYYMLFKNKIFLINTFALSLLVTILGVASSYYIGMLVDLIIPNSLSQTLNQVSIVFIGVSIMKCTFQYIRTKLVIRTSRKIEKVLTENYFSHLLKLPCSFFQKRELGDFISRFNDAITLTEIISNTVVTSFVDLILISVTGILLYRANHLLFCIALIPIILYSSIIYFFYESIHDKNLKVMKKHSAANSLFIQILNGVENIKALNKERYIEIITGMKIYDYINSALKLDNTNNTSNYIKSTIQASFAIIIMWIGSKEIFLGKLSTGTLFIFTGILSYFVGSIENIVKLQPTIQKAVVSAERLFEILDYNEIETYAKGNYINDSICNIKIDNLNFGYDDGEVILKDVSMSMNKGETIAFIGESGSGKSTLAKLLIRLWNLTDDSICINGIKISNIDINSLRERISYINNERFFFKGTILDNLCLGGKFEQEEIDKACKIACIYDFIKKLPKGYDFILSENANNLSLGQIQRISLARALLHKPDVIILDEVIGNVDKDNVLNIMDNLREFNCIKIFITHNLYLEDYYDKIYDFSSENVRLIKEMRKIS